MKKKKLAFTMAEVLIAIAIIGVIAALVLPVMMKNYNNRIFATKARRAYTAIVDACSHGLSDDQVKYPGDIINSYCEYIPGKSCTTGENGSITLKDGTVLTLTGWGNNPGGNLEVSIDTNGTKKPDTLGIDKWKTTLTRDCKLADNGSKGTIGYLKNHDWKIAGDDSSALSMESKCSFYGTKSICKQDDGTTKYCSSLTQSYCKTFEGECTILSSNYISCISGGQQKIYDTYKSLKLTLPDSCYALGDAYMSCPNGDTTEIYEISQRKKTATLPNNCDTKTVRGRILCKNGQTTDIYDGYGNLKKTIQSDDCYTIGTSSYLYCNEGNTTAVYDDIFYNKYNSFDSNCEISGTGQYRNCDGSVWMITTPGTVSSNMRVPSSNCKFVSNYMSCPDGDNQKFYNLADGITYKTFPNNYKPIGETGYVSYFDGTQTKVYSIYSAKEQTSYAKAGDCANDSNNLYVCTNGNKKTYYSSYDSSASSGVEVDADCADPFCSNKQ